MDFIELIKANKEKAPEAYELAYDSLVVALIRRKYSLNQELAILRQRDTKPLEYQEYFDYVERCKDEIKRTLS
jgi:hypothetical protein